MLFLIFGNALFYDFSKKPKGYTKIFFKAVFWNLANLGLILYENKKLRSSNKLSDKELDSYLLEKSIEISLVKNKKDHNNNGT